MNKDKVFVVGDVHGQISMLDKLLMSWKPDEERLLFIGDLADRGENSKAVLERVYELMKNDEAIVIKGNHDEMLENFLEHPSEYFSLYYMNGGESTIHSLLGRKTSRENMTEQASEIKEKYPWLLPMLKSLPLYYEWGDYLFVHAGVDLSLSDWRDSKAQDFIWIREGFHNLPNRSNKKIVFGHTVTATLHPQLSNYDIWESGDGLYGIDGGAVYGGKLHGLVLSESEKINHYYVENTEGHF